MRKGRDTIDSEKERKVLPRCAEWGAVKDYLEKLWPPSPLPLVLELRIWPNPVAVLDLVHKINVLIPVWNRRADSAVVISSCFSWSHPKDPPKSTHLVTLSPTKTTLLFRMQACTAAVSPKASMSKPSTTRSQAATPAPCGAKSHENWFWFGRNMVVPRELPALVLVVTKNSPSRIPAPATRATHMYHHNRRSHTAQNHPTHPAPPSS